MGISMDNNNNSDNNNEWVIQNLRISLSRWPLKQKNRSLQAWDSADEYLINYLHQQQLLSKTTNLLIINDNFGALSCFFHEFKPHTLIDSYVSKLAIEHNLKANQLNSSDVTILPSDAKLPDNIDIVLLKIPKNNGYLSQLLFTLAAHLSQQTRKCTIIAAGKTTDIHTSTLNLFEQYIGTTTTSLARKKSRLIFATPTLQQSAPKPPYPRQWQLPQSTLTIINHANVFSGESLDIGARLFIEHLPNCNQKAVIDLGCGNGVISATVMQLFTPTTVKLVDESYQAVKSAQATIAYNFPKRLECCEFVVDDCLSKQPNDSADVVLCNPPFHQQQAVTDHIAWQMFNDAHRVLKVGGLLTIVGNRNLGYHIKLKKRFGHCQQVASNHKFVILQTQKRR